ncbi:hypothetical protein EJ06DRAFT_402263 [Trichodelitschia bisporula]|uniref:Ubiquitin carboxyl-terminal hydrolase 19 n=1 Tax=Trichodelitschia bisporula TaxID=703511 RepID=A0A6G1HX98_9PEZI|nr:hypothetical protein EJ06DRAFT_402263 [Trichodelitschia bisporula]
MDPQSAPFTPRDDLWRFQTDVLRMQQTQQEHAERLLRLERKQEDDARMKSVWGTSSPFPGVLAGTPQQVPLRQPPVDAFNGFDDESSTNLIGSLHLDADEEPRRTGATSRANSVRFDETANQGHWSHASRSSIDLIPRASSSLSAHPLMERTYSHKSDGRQSSAGHSVHSATSGRANSLGLDTLFSAFDAPAVAPGMFVLGPVPSIIRCWLTTTFKHDSLLYAAVCTGSYTSYVDRRLVNALGLTDRVRVEGGHTNKLKLSVYLPEAVTRTPSSSVSSITPQLPAITVDFTVVTRLDENDRSIQIFIGSDTLRTHSADILFSSNTITMFDDDRCKLSVPMVRPEDERSFNGLFLSSRDTQAMEAARKAASMLTDQELLNGLRQSVPLDTRQDASSLKSSQSSLAPAADIASKRDEPADTLPPLGTINTNSESKPAGPTSAPARPGPSPAIWSNWRRDDKTAAPDAKSGVPRREGIKVLRPLKPAARTISSNSVATTTTVGGAASPAASTASTSGAGQSRFFDDGRRRTSLDKDEGKANGRENVGKEGAAAAGTAGKPRGANPVGGASAFAWLAK